MDSIYDGLFIPRRETKSILGEDLSKTQLSTTRRFHSLAGTYGNQAFDGQGLDSRVKKKEEPLSLKAMPEKVPMLPLFNSFADIDFKEPKIKQKKELRVF